MVSGSNQKQWNNNGTIEFTAVPNQSLDIDMNPLGSNTMIFNPYKMNKLNNPNNDLYETIIQPVIQPVIQTVYKNKPTTKFLEPIINEPIMDNFNGYSDYYNYMQNTMSLQPKQNTSDFQFNNENSDLPVPVEPIAPTPEPVLVKDPEVVQQIITRETPVYQKKVKEVSRAKPKVKKKRNIAVSIVMGVSLLLAVGIIVVVALILTKVIVI